MLKLLEHAHTQSFSRSRKPAWLVSKKCLNCILGSGCTSWNVHVSITELYQGHLMCCSRWLTVEGYYSLCSFWEFTTVPFLGSFVLPAKLCTPCHKKFTHRWQTEQQRELWVLGGHDFSPVSHQRIPTPLSNYKISAPGHPPRMIVVWDLFKDVIQRSCMCHWHLLDLAESHQYGIISICNRVVTAEPQHEQAVARFPFHSYYFLFLSCFPVALVCKAKWLSDSWLPRQKVV